MNPEHLTVFLQQNHFNPNQMYNPKENTRCQWIQHLQAPGAVPPPPPPQPEVRARDLEAAWQKIDELEQRIRALEEDQDGG